MTLRRSARNASIFSVDTIPVRYRSRGMTSGFTLDRSAACECDQIGPEERVYSRFFSQEQAIIAEMRMAAYLMLEGLGMIRGWLRNRKYSEVP
jgi:hypothetical protein